MDERDAAQRDETGANAASSTGLRIALERAPSGPPWRYRGTIVAAALDLDSAIAATVECDGTVVVTPLARATTDPEPDATEGAALEKVRLLLRTVWRQSVTDGMDPPRRIVRWRDSSGLAPRTT